MSDIKNVMELLCKHLNLSVNVAIKPEYFRLSKYNDETEKSDDVLWTVLHALSSYAAKEKQNDISFDECDKLSATKLYFAFLQYPALEFYGLSESCHNSRVLLLAFAWLLATQNVLSIVVRVRLTSSILGRECSYPEVSLKEVPTVEKSCSIHTQMKNIIHHNSKVNYNLKHISELLCEKGKVLNRAHGVSSNIGHTHLNVMEIAFIKRLLVSRTDSNSIRCKQQKLELHTLGTMLDLHLKWMEREHLFYDWMTTVIKEYEKSLNINTSRINWDEVGNFVSLLGSVLKRKLNSIDKKKTKGSVECFCAFQCASRLSRTSDVECEASKWLTDTTVQLDRMKETLKNNQEELALQLKNILTTMPLCIRI